MPALSEHRHVFICGLHRSGTSLLHRLLRAHPDISGFVDTGIREDEGQHLQDVYPAGKLTGGAGNFCFYKKSYLTERSELVTKENKLKLFEQWSKYWDLSKPVLIEKSPPNIIRSRFLQAMFPNSVFIFLLRHPVAVSFATAKWEENNNIVRLMEHWCIAHHVMRQDMQKLNQSVVLRYEDLITHPQDTLTMLCAALGLSSCPVEEEIDPNSNNMYFKQWEAYITEYPEARVDIKPFEDLPRKYDYLCDPPYWG